MTLIDAKKLIKAILDFPDCENGYSDTYDKEYIISEVEAQPTVDAVPVRHGRWIKEYLTSTGGGVYSVYRCSECEHTYQDIGYHFNWCPNCGCMMDGES